MRLEETAYDNSVTGCCAEVDPAVWNEKELHWQDKLFLKDHIRAFLHMPLNFGSVISRDHAVIQENAAYPVDPLWLTEEVSPWGSDVYVAVDRVIPGASIVKFSGTFLTKIFEGPYRDAPKWAGAMDRYVEEKGHEVAKLYFYYATCPKCSKKLGRNRVVLLAKAN